MILNRNSKPPSADAEQFASDRRSIMCAGQRKIRALLIAGVAVCAIAGPLMNIYPTPAAAQAVSLSAEFRTALEPYGVWQHHRRWGEVWLPSNVAGNWQPYTVGRWVYSDDYGWYWAPDEQEAEWGLVTYHYGRWAFDDQFGWMWIPGTEWGPGWVQWRYGGQHVGWEPLPPDDVVIEYRERPQFWVFVRERDLVAPRVAEVILPPQEREVFFRDTAVVNRTVELRDRRFGVNPGIPPTYIAAAYGRPIPSHEIYPRVFAGTANLPGAVVLRADVFRNRERVREIARETTHIRRTTNTVAPARELPPLQPLGASEHGRLGTLPPRAAQRDFTTTGQNRPEGSNAPTMPGAGQPQSRPAPSRQGAAPGQPLQQQGREGRSGGREAAPGAARPGTGPAQGALRGNQGQRDQRNQREGRPAPSAPTTTGAVPGARRNESRGDVRPAQPGRDQRGAKESGPGAPPNVPRTSREERRGPQSGSPIPSTSGAAPSSRERIGERELRSRPQQGAASPQEPRGRERPANEARSPRNQNFEGQRGPAQRPTAAASPQRPERGSSPGVEAQRSHAPAAPIARPQSPTTTGVAPGGGRAAPGAGGRREEHR
jgi:hypothetical protein